MAVWVEGGKKGIFFLETEEIATISFPLVFLLSCTALRAVQGGSESGYTDSMSEGREGPPLTDDPPIAPAARRDRRERTNRDMRRPQPPTPLPFQKNWGNGEGE